MAKKSSRIHRKQVAGRRGQWLAISMLLGLLVVGSVLAAWRGLWSSPKRRDHRQMATQGETPQPDRLNPANPTKEYIYAGSKLVATEEPAPRIADDFDADAKAELGYYRNGLWGFLKSSQNYSTSSPLFFSWGGAGNQPAIADFDGDGRSDIGFIEPPTAGQSAVYSILLSSRGYSFATGQPLFVPAGFPSVGDTPVYGDFDGDGKADPSIWRASQGLWFLQKSSVLYSATQVQWGQAGDTPIVADFDGDGKADIGYYRAGVWGILKSSQNYSTGSPQYFSWGGSGYQAIVGDFDGDTVADIGYMVPPTSGQSAAYAILLSSRNYSFAPGQPLFVPAGYPSLGDTPVVADFDGDGKSDPAIWRASQGIWIIPTSSSNYTSYIFAQWGAQGDIILPNKTNM